MNRNIGPALSDSTFHLTGEQALAADRRERPSIPVTCRGHDLLVYDQAGMCLEEEVGDDTGLGKSEPGASRRDGYLCRGSHESGPLVRRGVFVVQIEQHPKGIEILLALFRVAELLAAADGSVQQLRNDAARHLIYGVVLIDRQLL